MTILDLALSYAADMPVFPCRAAADGEHAEKSPYTPNGLNGASKNTRIIERWWLDHPDALIGVPTGEKSGFFVLDLDVKADANGHDWLAEKQAEHGPLPETRRVGTANGGTHVFFNMVEGIRNRGKLHDAVDVRGEGGYIIAAGSVMADGREYWVIEDRPIADAPQWLLDLVLPRATQTPTVTPLSYKSGTNDHYVNRSIDAELHALASTAEGGRGYALNASAFSIGQFVGAGAVSRTEAETGLYQAAIANGLLAKDGEREVWAKIRRGLTAGMKQPRDIPEPDFHANDNTKLVDVTRLIENGKKKAGAQVESEKDDAKEQPAVVATPFSLAEACKTPPREFVYGNRLIRKYVSVTVAQGGVGKSNLINAEAVAIATGKPLFETKLAKPMRVWVFNAEDPRDELYRRLWATCIHYNISQKDIADRLHLDTGREQELCVAMETKDGVRYHEPVIEAVVAEIKRRCIDVMVVDPFVSTHDVNENNNGAIDKVVKLWSHIADETNCAIEIVHHLRKVSDGREATIDDARGAKALSDGSRSVRVLNRMSSQQAKEAGVSESERLGIFSATDGKSSLTPMSSAKSWYQLVSVPLGNGQGLTRPQDHAPVAVKWNWPTIEEILEVVPADKVSLVKTRIANGDFAYNWQAKNWAGQVVADILEIELPGGAKKSSEHKQVERLIEGWVETGVLKIEKCKGLKPTEPDKIMEAVRVA